jgi:hypothetical protein
MEQIAGYARVMARTRIRSEARKRLLGKPFVYHLQGVGLWGYMLQLGTVLGARHRSHCTTFGLAFLGSPELDRDTFETFFENSVRPVLERADSFRDYVAVDFTRRAKHDGDPYDFMIALAKAKLDLESAEEIAWQYAVQGASIGSVQPNTGRALYERTHRPVPPDEWSRWHAAGLDIPKEQDIISYDEVDSSEHAVFIEYCRGCCPDAHAVLA